MCVVVVPVPVLDLDHLQHEARKKSVACNALLQKMCYNGLRLISPYPAKQLSRDIVNFG